MKNKKKKNATEKELDDQRIQDGAGKEDKENTETANGKKGEDGEGDNDETEGETRQKEQAELEGRDENVTEEVEAEVRRETDGKRAANGKQEEAGDEIETLSDVKNGETGSEEGRKSGEENYHLHNGLDEEEQSTNEAQDENGIDVEHIDSANQE